MTTLALDTDRARSTGSALIRSGDAAYDTALELRTLLDGIDLEFTGLAARLAIEDAAAESWRAGAFLHLVSDRVDDADRLDAAVIADCRALATGSVGRHSWFRPWWLGASGPDGELHGTYDRELRSPYTVFGDDDVERARALLVRALADTANPRQIRGDEFGIVDLGAGRYVVVLPGVTDLSSLDPHLSDDHRSVRDLDEVAIGSAWSTSVADNRYAEMVWEGMVAAGVPTGANVLIVGHSFGADTALDLAADPQFNGPDGFAVSHVVAAGYYSQPQLEHVPESTDVLVLQNHRDAAVIVESAGHSNLAKGVTSGVDSLQRMLRGDLFGAFGAGRDSLRAGLGTIADTRDYVVDHAGDFADVAAGVGTLDLDRAAEGAADLVTIEPRIEQRGHLIVDVFEGGSSGAGHHPSNYVTHLDATESPEVLAFLASVAGRGFTTGGSAVAVDVSIPAHR